MGTRTFSPRQQLDWQAFNGARVSSFYAWLCNAIENRYPANQGANQGANKATACYAKTSNSASGVHPVTRRWPVRERGDPDGGAHGIDRQRLFAVFGRQACDTRMVPTSQPHFQVVTLNPNASPNTNPNPNPNPNPNASPNPYVAMGPG